MQKEKSANERVQIITPLPISKKKNGADRSAYDWHQLFKVSALIGVLAATLIAGGWLLFYVSQNPIQTTAVSKPDPTAKPQTQETPVETTQKSLPQSVAPADLAPQKTAAEEKIAQAVMRLLQSGKQHEDNDDLSAAHTDYREAFRLDPQSQTAQTALKRIDARIAEAQFQKLMSAGLTAFHHNDFELARSNLLKAKAIKPQSREVNEALAQAEEAIRLSRIEELHQEALAAEQSEDWETALKSYLAVLKIDDNIQFAVQGRDRSSGQIQMAKRINFFLDKPELLESDNQLKNAILLVREAESFEPQGPHLQNRLEKLTRLVTTAQTPVKIIIESDNQTEVAIYKVGKLGRFEIRELTLRPGTYTVVGARDGYKDVRQTLVVKPDGNEVRVRVKCKVKI